MKTHAFKKAISVVCVLAMLMSVCVVSFAGGAYAAEQYTFNANGVVTYNSLEAGAALTPAADLSANIKFVGWYDKSMTTKYDVAGADKVLYAKYSSTVLDFENGKQYFYPHEGDTGYYPFGDSSTTSAFVFEADPADSSNKVIALHGGKGGTSFGLPVAPDTDTGFTLVAGQKYEVNFDYMYDGCTKNATNPDSLDGINIELYAANAEGIGVAGNKDRILGKRFQEVESDGWQNYSLVFTAGDNVNDKPYLLFYFAGCNNWNPNTNIYIDNIIVTPVTEKNVTLNNRGVVTTGKYNIGDKLPTITSTNFMGWYDKALSTKYNIVSASCSEYFARYKSVSLDFETKGYYDPNGVVAAKGTSTSAYSVETAVDPLDPNNKVMVFDHVGNGDTQSFAPVGAVGADAGFNLEAGKVYVISFKYLVEGENNYGTYFSFRLAADAGVGMSGNKAPGDFWSNGRNYSEYKPAANTWTEFSVQVTAPADVTTYPNLIMLCQDGARRQTPMGSATTAVYIDDFEIKPYVAPTVLEDFEMDFENNFKWSVADANNYTYNSGNGYVSRGEIVADGDNKVFKMTNFEMKNKYTFFTVNDGQKQLTLTPGGLYTVSFKYKVLHSETPVDLGITYVKPTTSSTGVSIAAEPIEVFESIDYRDDLEPRENIEWQYVEYSFCAGLDAQEMTSLAIYLKNSTNVPLEYATVVLFDDVVVKTHSTTGEDALITFDTLGGEKISALTIEIGDKFAQLPIAVKYGYDFTGWKYDVVTGTGDNAVVNTYDFTTDTAVNDVVINAYATYKLSDGVIELNFRTNNPDYDAVAPTIVAYPGQPVIGMPANPTFTNQRFVGWYLDRGLTKAFDVNSAPSQSTTLFAKWESDGSLVDFENYPTSIVKNAGYVSERYRITTTTTGNKVLTYDFANSTSNDPNGHARAALYDNANLLRCTEGETYKITFKYMVESVKQPGSFFVYLSNKGASWGNYTQQSNCTFKYTEPTDGWVTGELEFVATLKSTYGGNDNYLYLAASGNAVLHIDDVVVSGPDNNMNVYGTAVYLNTQGGKKINPVTGEPGDKIVLPKPYKAGYKFLKWTVDKAGNVPFTETVFGEESLSAYAQWQLGRYTEGFEDYPSTVKALGVAGAYTFYDKSAVGFDASNIRSGDFSLYRNGTTAGSKLFTLMRATDLVLTPGETYVLEMYVKPTSITNPNANIELHTMSAFTGITKAKVGYTVASVGSLKENEWNLVTLTFVAKAEFYAIATTEGNDMYFDDISITLQGFTGDEAGADTGDSSVSPFIVLAMVILSAGAMLIAGKKVFAK